jgi:nitroimidazol reductase NimA-like FMN-containing flavoprotein (pyridoxamine 5'-phosphate oxidase superfamily)
MRKITNQEAQLLLKEFCWGTLCSVTFKVNPYAIEFSYFTENNKIYAVINPRGQTAENIKQNPNICFKVCDTDKKNAKYRAISCFGTAKFTSPDSQEKIIFAWKKLAVALGRNENAFKAVWNRFSLSEKPLPLLEITINKITGVTNYGQQNFF